MQYVGVFILFVHALIHLAGISKKYTSAKKDSTKWLWIAACVCLAAAAIALLAGYIYWWFTALAGVLLSQTAIRTQWQKAKAGTLVNVLIAAFITQGYAGWHFYHKYKKDVAHYTANIPATDQLTEDDIKPLPEPVKKYIKYTGAIGKPQVESFYVKMTGTLRKSRHSEEMPFQAEQYNTISNPARLFFLNAIMQHLPVAGYHCYKDGKASMDIKIFSLIPVQQQDGYKMDQSETVTYFNDMCVFAPGALTDKRITWLNTYGNKVEALFTNKDITVRAWLYFNDSGQLVNFISGDRFATTDSNTLVQRSWSTPLTDYRTINGLKLATKAQAIYDYEEGPFAYGTFSVVNIVYNKGVNN